MGVGCSSFLIQCFVNVQLKCLLFSAWEAVFFDGEDCHHLVQAVGCEILVGFISVTFDDACFSFDVDEGFGVEFVRILIPVHLVCQYQLVVGSRDTHVPVQAPDLGALIIVG